MSWLDSLLGRSTTPATPDPDGALLRCTNLHLTRGHFHLHIPELTVFPGTVTGLVGPNASGKSTLLETLVGLRPSADGSARVLGLNPHTDGPRIREAVALTSDHTPVRRGRIRDVLANQARFYPSWDATLEAQLLERFQLHPDTRVEALSTGQTTRFRLVQALAWKPRLVLLDEPGLGLDLTQRRALFTTVLDIVADPTRAVVISSHQLADLERMVDHLAVLADGSCVRQGPIDDLVSDDLTLEEALLRWGAA